MFVTGMYIPRTPEQEAQISAWLSSPAGHLETRIALVVLGVCVVGFIWSIIYGWSENRKMDRELKQLLTNFDRSREKEDESNKTTNSVT